MNVRLSQIGQTDESEQLESPPGSRLASLVDSLGLVGPHADVLRDALDSMDNGDVSADTDADARYYLYSALLREVINAHRQIRFLCDQTGRDVETLFSQDATEISIDDNSPLDAILRDMCAHYDASLQSLLAMINIDHFGEKGGPGGPARVIDVEDSDIAPICSTNLQALASVPISEWRDATTGEVVGPDFKHFPPVFRLVRHKVAQEMERPGRGQDSAFTRVVGIPPKLDNGLATRRSGVYPVALEDPHIGDTCTVPVPLRLFGNQSSDALATHPRYFLHSPKHLMKELQSQAVGDDGATLPMYSDQPDQQTGHAA